MVTRKPPNLTSGLSAGDFWARPASERAATFAALRGSAPVSFHQLTDLAGRSMGRGFWAVTRHADVHYIGRTPQLFCSGHGVGLGQAPIEVLELNASFLVMDAPRHTALRRVVSRAFTPKQIDRLIDAITAEAARIVDEFVEHGGGEVVEDLSKKLPLWTISNMMGVPESLRDELYHAAELQIAVQDPEFVPPGGNSAAVAIGAGKTMHRIAKELAAARRAQPADDIFSAFVHSEIDGAPLTDQMLGALFALFATGGNDTTRTTTSHAMKLFSDNREQLSRLVHKPLLIDGAVEEMLRCATPVIHFRRTATTDTELNGVPIAQGDAVVMFYESANRDEAVFDDPARFDITRNPNPHVSFGGGGPHFCLGASLARAQLRALFSKLAERVATIEAGEPHYLASNFINGIKRMSVTVTRR